MRPVKGQLDQWIEEITQQGAELREEREALEKEVAELEAALLAKQTRC